MRKDRKMKEMEKPKTTCGGGDNINMGGVIINVLEKKKI
jgi:hypothetical protein